MSSWLRCKNSLRFIGPSQAGEINLPEPFRDGEEFSESRVFSNVLKKDLRASDLQQARCMYVCCVSPKKMKNLSPALQLPETPVYWKGVG
eukprot:scaffold135886_cov46-Cyclotella_meneghiniana.AAC.1